MGWECFQARGGGYSRRVVAWGFCSAVFSWFKLTAQEPGDQQTPDRHKLKFPGEEDDPRLPDGKSQKNAIAKDQHEQALRDADQLVTAATELRDELRRVGTFVVPVTAVKKTEEIEKMAKRIRSRLKS